MKTNRRNFLKTATVAGAGAMAGGIFSGCAPKEPESNLASIVEAVKRSHTQRFNMSGYAAPAIPVVRIGIIGLGDRGSDAVERRGLRGGSGPETGTPSVVCGRHLVCGAAGTGLECSGDWLYDADRGALSGAAALGWRGARSTRAPYGVCGGAAASNGRWRRSGGRLRRSRIRVGVVRTAVARQRHPVEVRSALAPRQPELAALLGAR